MMTYPDGRAHPSAGTRVKLLDIQQVDGTITHLADRAIMLPPAIPYGAADLVAYLPWLKSAGPFKRTRSMTTDLGSFTVQCVSGDTLRLDFERFARKVTLEGALFIFRYWQVDGAFAWDEWHGQLSLGDVDRDNGVATINAKQLFDGSDTSPSMELGETCQLDWGKTRCGSTAANECNYTAQTCQVPAHYVGIKVDYTEKNYSATVTNVAQTVPNRRRRV